ncbi:MAG: FHA domain-containing protein [Pseudolysinimonas sp.]
MTVYSVTPDSREPTIALSSGDALLVMRPSATVDPSELLAILGEPDAARRVLEVLSSSGLAQTPDFALIAPAAVAGSVRAIVRGALMVTADGDAGRVELTGTDVAAWNERVLASIASVDVRPLGAPVPAGLAAVSAASIVIAEPAVATPGAPRERDHGSATDAAAEQTISVVPESVERADDLAAFSAIDAGADEGYDHLFEATVVRSIEDAAVRSDEPAEAGAAETEADGDHDGMTVMSDNLVKMRGRSVPSEHEIAQAPPALSYTLVMPSGARESLTDEVLVGRSPSAKLTGGVAPRLLAIADDPDLSRTHVRFALEGDTVVVTDMHSRNGTSVVLPGKSPQLLRAGEPAAVVPGTVVDLGGGTVITVEGGTE